MPQIIFDRYWILAMLYVYSPHLESVGCWSHCFEPHLPQEFTAPKKDLKLWER